jgi:hypothetical protein
MKKILYILFFIFVFASVSLDNIAFAESKLDKVKNKIKESESKLVGKIWGTRDCSQHSTKTLTGLAKYKRCKSGLKPIEKKSWKKTKVFDPNKPCNEYSTKTFTGLAAKMKCKRVKKK